MFPKSLRIAVVGSEWLRRINATTVIKKIFPTSLMRRQLNTLASALDFSYKYVYPKDYNAYGRRNQSTGSWSGALGMVERGEADMTICGLAADEDNYDDFFTPFPKDLNEVTFITRKHVYVPNTTVFLHPFSAPVWFTIIACVCIMPFIFRCLLKRKQSRLFLATSTISPLINQGIEMKPHKAREYFLLASWIMSSGLLSYFYSAVLLSFLTFPSLQGIRTIEDLANGIKEGKYYCVTYPRTFYIIYFLDSSNPSLKVIGRSLAQNQPSEYFVDVLETFIDGKIPVFIGYRRDFHPYNDLYFISEENFMFVTGTFALQKEFCCKSELDEVIHRIWESKLFEKQFSDLIFKAFLDDYTLYGKDWEKNSQDAALTMKLLKGPFLFLMFSHSLAFLVFLAELLIGKFTKSN